MVFYEELILKLDSPACVCQNHRGSSIWQTVVLVYRCFTSI